MTQVRDGHYQLSLTVDEYIGSGTLTMVSNNGQGHDGTFKVEVHVSGASHELQGIVNVLLTAHGAERDDVPRHFSLPVVGSGHETGFNLIGHGPRSVLVEVDAQWDGALSRCAS